MNAYVRWQVSARCADETYWTGLIPASDMWEALDVFRQDYGNADWYSTVVELKVRKIDYRTR